MDISTSTIENVAVVRLRGRFEFANHREFSEAVKLSLANSTAKEIKIDSSGVDYMDSAALGMLLLARERAQAIGKTVTLANAKGAVKQILGVANFEKLFTFV